MTSVGANPKKPGLCQTCRCSDSCSLPGREKAEVLHCEEFENAVDAGVVRAAPTPEKTGSPAVTPEEDPMIMGLCVDCLARSTCRSAKTAGGIWFCEEYE